MSKTLALTPAGHLIMVAYDEPVALLTTAPEISAIIAVEDAFAVHQAEGLLALTAASPDPAWPLSWHFWREFTSRYLTLLCQIPRGVGEIPLLPCPDGEECNRLVLAMPPIVGAEYATAEVLAAIWNDLDGWTHTAVGRHPDGLAGFLRERVPLWRQVGRVSFHLAENRGDPEYPFAFLATYAPKIGKNARLQYQPLGKALTEYTGTRNRETLIRLLEPVHEASTSLAWVRELVESGDIYHPIVWTPEEAYAMLTTVPELEASGLVVRLPDWWKKRPRPRVVAAIGSRKAAGLGAAMLLDFKVRLALDGEPLTEEEIAAILASGQGLTLLRGQWVEVDGEKLKEALAHWQQIEAEAGEEGLSFAEGMRLLAGSRQDPAGGGLDTSDASWSFAEAGQWLNESLSRLRSPETLAAATPGPGFTATLRPYQQTGVNWLWFLSELGLGACLADDMGLGKTIQVIALLVIQKNQRRPEPSLLVLPASLLSNWKAELGRFAPGLTTLFLHPAETPNTEIDRLGQTSKSSLAGIDVVVTTYGMLQRLTWLREREWNLAVLDEAQAIKNPGTNQAKAVRTLSARTRLALTGTPVENRPADLWSLFDFLCPGLLGTATRFRQFLKKLESGETANYGPLRQLVQPYILRRLKTDSRIIDDLPEKTEMTVWCGLTRTQAGLYSEAVRELTAGLDGLEGIKRRGLILSFLMRFKQICNHPSQATGDGDYSEEASGKFARLGSLAGEIAGRQEKVLVFTQFREVTGPLAAFLGTVFGRPGLVLHGGTRVKDRQRLVDYFQREDGPPFFILSLKAAGIGLNLTAASHVIHFDRWWNPAVENQATDRAFRIGQRKNVVVHKFVCRGTVEEKIDALISEKTKLATELLAEGGETLLTEMDDQRLMDLVHLDIDKATM